MAPQIEISSRVLKQPEHRPSFPIAHTWMQGDSTASIAAQKASLIGRI